MMLAAAIVSWLAPWCLLLLGVAMLLSMLRLLRGPTGADRAMALDVVTVLAAAFVGILALNEDESSYLSVALVIALVSFLGTVAIALFLQHARNRGSRHGR